MKTKIHILPIKIQGIKTKLVAWIQENVVLEKNSQWVEPFMGSGVVGFNLAPLAFACVCTGKQVPSTKYQTQNKPRLCLCPHRQTSTTVSIQANNSCADTGMGEYLNIDNFVSLLRWKIFTNFTIKR